MTGGVGTVLLGGGVAVATAMVATAIAARRTRRWSVVDVTWGLGFVVIAVVSGVFGAGNPWRRTLFMVLVGFWGGRLAWHIWQRSRGHGEDPRYAAMREQGRGGLVRRVLAPQGIVMWLIALPVMVAAVGDRSLGWVAAAGVVVWLVGVAFETVGDAQLRAFKADPANRGRLMDRGLWAWTRHPNYFGDACLWWGMWLVAAETGWLGILTVVSPIAMTYFIRNISGAKLLERSMSKRPGWDAYAARVPMFFPRPPRRTSP